MKYLSVNTATLRDSEIAGTADAGIVAWLKLSGYCADHENGGIIKKCAGWESGVWERMCGVKKESIEAAPLLLKWADEDLVVFDYPDNQEKVQQAKRKGGAAGGKKRVENLLKQQELDGVLNARDKVNPGKSGRPLTVDGYGDINNTRNDLVDVASAITGDHTKCGRKYWRTALEKIGGDQFRAQCVTLYGEMNAGERPPNPAAVLTGRIKKLVERYEARGAG